MADLSKIGIPMTGTGTLQPMCVKTEWLWHSHIDTKNLYVDCSVKAEVMVKYEICIYSDRTSTIEVVEEMSNEEWFKQKLAGTLQGHWSLCPQFDR